MSANIQIQDNNRDSKMNKPIMITLEKIKDHNPCDDYDVLKSHLGDDFPLDREFPLSLALDVEGYKYQSLSNVIWCFRAIPEHTEIVQRFAIWAARQVKHLMKDERSIYALDVAEKSLDGKATKEDLKEAACSASAAHEATASAASYAAYSAFAAVDAYASAASYAASAASAAVDACAAREKHAEKLRRVLTAGEWIK